MGGSNREYNCPSPPPSLSPPTQQPPLLILNWPPPPNPTSSLSNTTFTKILTFSNKKNQYFLSSFLSFVVVVVLVPGSNPRDFYLHTNHLAIASSQYVPDFLLFVFSVNFSPSCVAHSIFLKPLEQTFFPPLSSLFSLFYFFDSIPSSVYCAIALQLQRQKKRQRSSLVFGGKICSIPCRELSCTGRF